jgi:FAD/FMN-containing dehydrogenase
MDRLYSELLETIEGVVYTPDQLREEYRTNFGHIHYWTPRFMVEPRHTRDVAAVVRFAREHGLTVSTRGSAHSQSELGINRDGVLLSMKAMSTIHEVDESTLTVDVDAGVVWRDLAHHLKRYSLVPRVLTNNLGVTVGGTLSMAGIGVASFLHGSQGDNVEELEVVLGTGEVRSCGPDDDPELFWSVIAGLGQVAIITRARLELRRAKSMTRTYYLLYDDIRKFMHDAASAMDSGKWDHLESWASPCPQGTKPVEGRRQVFAKWFYPFHLTVEFEPGDPLDDAGLLAGLEPYDHLYTDDLPTIDFLERLVPVFELWRRGGTWEHVHPWMEVVLPWETAADYIDAVLPDLPPAMLVGGHILLWPAKGTTSRSRLFMRPDGENLIGFGILPAVPPRFWPQLRPLLENASRLSIAMGGKRYLSGYVDFSAEEWREHYGERWTFFAEAKRRYDPDGILNPGFVPLAAGEPAASEG